MTEWDKLWDFDYNVDHGLVLHATWVRKVKAEGDRLQEELETRSSLEVLERIGESEAHKKIRAALKGIEEWCSDCLKPKFTCASCIYQRTKEELGYRPRLSRGEPSIKGE